MGQSGAKPVDELIQHEFTLHHAIRVIGDLVRYRLQETSLNLTQRFRRRTTPSSKFRIRLLPLAQLGGSLALNRVHLLNELFQ